MKKLPKSDLVVFNQILNTPIEVVAIDETHARQIEIALSICKRPWEVTSSLFIQNNWSSRFGLKVTKRDKTLYEPYLNLMTTIYELIKEIDALHRYTNIELSDRIRMKTNPIAWVSRCFVDFTAVNFYALAYDERPKIYNNNHKEAIIEIERERLRKLKNNINPFEEKYFGIYNVVHASFQLKSSYDQFDKKYWKPFLKAYTQL
ncbi:hypothetical protein, partial [Allocoleopsis sp.]|uniref:hypothetical protein n=1 Tax=Allocoleopsis sp. TaxID=3088169 RepID=UPI002FD06C6E